MERRLFVRLTGLCVIWGVSGITGSGQTTPSEREVMQAIDQINTAFQHRDTKAYEALTTADFVRVTSQGRTFGRAEWLKTVAAPGAERGPAKFDRLSVARVFGNGAVVSYRNIPSGTGGQPGVGEATSPHHGEAGHAVEDGARAEHRRQAARATHRPGAGGPARLVGLDCLGEGGGGGIPGHSEGKPGSRRGRVEKLSAADHSIIGADGTRTSRAERVAALKGPAPRRPRHRRLLTNRCASW